MTSENRMNNLTAPLSAFKRIEDLLYNKLELTPDYPFSVKTLAPLIGYEPSSLYKIITDPTRNFPADKIEALIEVTDDTDFLLFVTPKDKFGIYRKRSLSTVKEMEKAGLEVGIQAGKLQQAILDAASDGNLSNREIEKIATKAGELERIVEGITRAKKE